MPTEGSKSGQSTAASREQDALDEAQSAMSQGDDARAQNILKRACTLYPQAFEVNEALGLLYASQSDFVIAVHYLGVASRNDPHSAVGHANLGIAYLKLRRGSEAAKELGLAAQADPGNAQTEEAWGESLMLLSEWRNADAAFAKALAHGKSDPDLIYDDALALFHSGQVPQALVILQRMPDQLRSASVRSLFGDIEEKLGHYREAGEYYVEAAQIDPSEANIYTLGIEFLRHWTFDPAIREFTLGVQKFPDSQRLRIGLGLAYYANANYDQSISTLSDIVSSDPKDMFAAELLGHACTVLAEGLNPHCAVLIHAAEIHSNDAVLATYAAASILHKDGGSSDLEMARRFLQRAIQQHPELAQAHIEFGVLLQAQNLWKESIDPLETGIRLKPDDAQAHYRLSRAYAHEERHADAQKEIALFKQYSSLQQKSLDSRMNEIKTLIVKFQ